MIKLTYFTPAYNAEKTLPNLYQALCNQTIKDFVWLVVDDGSVDNTSALVREYIEHADFSIVLFQQENGGKHRAYNKAIKECNTELLCCVDADFVLVENATEKILNEWKNYAERTEVAGIVTPIWCKNSMTDLNQTKEYIGFSAKTPDIGRMPELYSKYGYHGETLYPFRTTVLKEYMFPDIPNEKFMTESTIYLPISTQYKVHWMNQCLAQSTYMEGGLSDRRFYNQANSPLSTMLFYKLSAQCHPSLITRTMNCGCYYAWKKVFKLSETADFRKYSLPFFERILGGILVPHYIRLFQNNIKKFLK